MTGTLPRRHHAAPARDAEAPECWSEDRIARLIEDAARRTPGVYAPTATVRADEHAARADLELAVGYGEHLPTVAEAVRRRVAARIEAHTGLTVPAVTVTVVDLVPRLPDDSTARESGRLPGRGDGHTDDPPRPDHAREAT